ncbi:hypothetical protein B296_00010228, partial [Ensete ventricosum]
NYCTYILVCSDFEVDYGSEEHANIVYATLAVDKEVCTTFCQFPYFIFPCQYRHFEAVEARFLRASFSAFVDLMILTTQIIEEYN